MLEHHLDTQESTHLENSKPKNCFYHDYEGQGDLIYASYIPGNKIIPDLIFIKSVYSRYVQELSSDKVHYFYLDEYD